MIDDKIAQQKDERSAELSIARKIQIWRAIRNLSQIELAHQIHCDQAIVSRWECGVTRPGKEDLERLAIVLGVEDRVNGLGW